ncbi:MAG: hypothetical protein N2445_03320 [Acidobacteria bacterium]|nr:hypothetical protein [Acidobacteriota bacterium]
MKRLFLVLFIFSLTLVVSAQGIKYRGEVKMENPEVQVSKEDAAQARQMGLGSFEKIEFEAMAQGGKYKMVYLNDFAVFRKGTYILGDANTKLAYFVFPETKTYWEMNIDEMGKAAQSLQKAVKMKYSNQSVTVSPLPPKVINTLPCTGKRIEISYDVETSMLGMKQKSHTKQVTDYYSTAVYDVLALFGGHNWHNQGFSIGDPVFDKEIAAKVGFLGFPVQVTTETWNDGKYGGKSTLTTKDVQLTAILPGEFSIPSGYKKEDAGFSSLLKQIGSSEEKGGESKETAKDEEKKQDENAEKEEKSDKTDEALKKAGKKILKKVIKKVVN